MIRLTAFAAGTLAAAVPGAASAATQTDSYAYTGTEQTFVVPSFATQIDVVVTGARGGSVPSPGAAGGNASTVTGPVSVTPGSTLYVEVGGIGGAGGATIGFGGFNGGGIGGTYSPGPGIVYHGAGGGGASDIRTVPRAQGTTSLNSRLVIAAGGGGGGAGNPSGIGGTGGVGGNAVGSGGPGTGGGACQGGGGSPPVTTAGGNGGVNGSPGCNAAAANGVNGALGEGGQGGVGQGSNSGAGGGGGGGGWYGGGGGAGGGSFSCPCGGAGGGGGSGISLQPNNNSAGTQGPAAPGAPPAVQITYTIPEGTPPPPPQGTGTGSNPPAIPPDQPPPDEGATPPPGECNVPLLANGKPRKLAAIALRIANAGCATGNVTPNPVTLSANEPYVVWAQQPRPDVTRPFGTAINLDLVTVFWFQTQEGLARADEIRKSLLNGADRALADEIGMDVAGKVSAKVLESIQKNLPPNLSQHFTEEISAQLVARLTLPIDGLLGGAFGTVISQGLAKFLAKVMPDELKSINDAIDPVSEFADRVENEVSKFFAPAGKFLDDIKQEVDGFLDKNILDPVKDAVTRPLHEAIGKPLSKIYKDITKAISDTIGKPINDALQSVKKFFKGVGCSVKKLFGGKKC